jgi:glycine/D-amino acid oxidase-like deaminating enzyme
MPELKGMHLTPAQLRAGYDCIVIGGGFYGCTVAEQLAENGNEVLLVEQDPDIMLRASYLNQARIHHGYHYPRSIITSLRSRVNFPRFIREYSSCIYNDFDKYYAIGKASSKVTASQFRLFCERIEAPLEEAPQNVKSLFNRNLIEDIFRVKEYAFDADLLKLVVQEKLDASGVSVLANTSAGNIAQNNALKIRVELSTQGELRTVEARRVFNCSYSQINRLLSNSNLPLIPLKHELAEMALIDPPEPLRKTSVTVLDGPYFSLMPFPSRKLHTLSHVRYTPHHCWVDENSRPYFDADNYRNNAGIASRSRHMILDAQRYLPVLGECRYVESLWEIKTVLPQSEMDDSRPILFKKSDEIPGLVSILGGKIDNIYDIKDCLEDVDD